MKIIFTANLNKDFSQLISIIGFISTLICFHQIKNIFRILKFRWIGYTKGFTVTTKRIFMKLLNEPH